MTSRLTAILLTSLGLSLLGATVADADQTPARVAQWRPLIQQIAADEGVDPLLVEAMVAIESGGNPNAHSPAGAVGLMQVMPATARLYGVRGAALWEPAVNIRVGVRYLADELAACGGHVPCALAAYNCGGSCARRGRWPAETRAYVPRVMHYWQFLHAAIQRPPGSRHSAISVEW